MPEKKTDSAAAAPAHYPADGATGVLTPSARLRRQLIKGGAGTVLVAGAAWAGWSKILFPERSADSDRPALASTTPPNGGVVVAADPKKNLGAVSKFAPGAPVLATLGGADGPGYLVDNLGGGQFRVLTARCTHKGCTVGWSPKDSQFVCPCHDGRFSRDGTNVAGPPPSPLTLVNARVVNGDLFVA